MRSSFWESLAKGKLRMRFVIVTGMSGAGKSVTLKMLEDMGYYCVDNLPIPLVGKFMELLSIQNQGVLRVALGVDIRSGDITDMETILEQFGRDGIDHEVLFLESTNEVLIKRYKETRRNHPLAGGGRINGGIKRERKLLEGIKKRADYILDTSNLLTRELRKELEQIFVNNREYKNLFINIVSFGFKYGIPNDSDLVFDVRFMPNPYYVSGLREKTGNDPEVQEFVMNSHVSREFLDRLSGMVKFLIPNYVKEGKNQLVISIGCTGGKHRSVTMANKLYELIKDSGDYGIKIEHRDIDKDSHRKG